MRNKHALGWFLFGLGGQLQLVASLSMTELFVFIAAPILFLRERNYMQRNGVMPFFYMSLSLVLGCVVSCVLNHTQLVCVVRGMAVCCLMPCAIIVGHWMLRRDMAGFRWMLVGLALSGVLCTFVFQKSVDLASVGGAGENAAGDIMRGATYWTHQVSAFFNIPIKGWYLQCPLLVSILVPLGVAGFAMMTTVSGRGMALQAIASAVLVIIGGKTRTSLRFRLCKNFWLIVAVGGIGVFAIKAVYQTAATSGWLGERARIKYEQQTKGDSGIMSLLMGGRMESFCGLLACVDKPIVGFGPWALDNRGYRAKFLRKYADQDDYDYFLKMEAFRAAYGGLRIGLIPCHSVVTMMWLWYGVGGLMFVLYMMYVMVRYLRQDCWAVPQWFFWLGASVPGVFWDLCFNPFSNRVALPLCVVACLLARAVRKNLLRLPPEMEVEIMNSERR